MATLAHLLSLRYFHERFEIDRLWLLSFICRLLFNGWWCQLGPVSIGYKRFSPVFEDRAGLGSWRGSLIHVSIDSIRFLCTSIIFVARQLRLDGKRDLRFAAEILVEVVILDE